MNARFGIVLATLGFAALVSAAAAADETAMGEWEDPNEGYCEWVRGAAASQRAILLAPGLFGATGPSYAGFEDTGDEMQDYGTLGWRVTAGMQYRFDNIPRGMLTMKQADAECERYRAQSELRNALSLGGDLAKLPAVEAQLAVLEGAIPRAESLVQLLEQGLEINLSTVDELYRARLQVDSLHKQAVTLRQEVQRLSQLPEVDGKAFSQLVSRHSNADDEVERIQGRLRRNSAWAMDLRGGYDQLIGYPRDLPVFAQLRLSYSLGGVGQLKQDRRAAEGRRAWRSGASESVGARMTELRTELLAVYEGEQERYGQVAPLIRDVEARMESLKAVETDRARKVHEGLWLDFVRLDAERAFLEAHMDALEGVLGLEPRAELVRVGESVMLASSGDEVPPEGNGVATALRSVPHSEFHATKGAVRKGKGGTLLIEDGKVRAVSEDSTEHTAEMRFKYLGVTKKTTALGSGAVRQQAGLKLRAANGCNLIYVMWRFKPESQIVVSYKSNPGETVHKECGTDGYTNLAYLDIAPVEVGVEHVLKATNDGQHLTVWADGVQIWDGDLGEAVLEFDGHPGFRSDNARLEMELLLGD